MKRWVLLGLLAVATTASAEVKPGDSLQSVLAALGPPQGFIRSPDHVFLFYERGRVELSGDRVVRAELVSAEEAVRQRALRQQREAAAREADARRRMELTRQGTDIRDQKLRDALFLVADPREQVDYWKRFQTAYPDVDIVAPYSAALNLLKSQQRAEALEEKHRQELAALEARVADAEERARLAENRVRYVPVVYPVWTRTGCATKPACEPTAAPTNCAPRGSGFKVRIGQGPSSSLTFVSRL